MEIKPSYTTHNGRLTALDGTYYRIRFPYSRRERPEWLGPVNFDPICSECGENIPGSRPNAMTCSQRYSTLRGARRKRE